MSTRHRSLLTMLDYGPDEIFHLLARAMDFKRYPHSQENTSAITGKNVALIFAKPSTRTRVSFEVAVNDMGGHPIYLSSAELQLGRGETIADTALVLSRYVDAIVIRTYSHADVETLATAATIPVINALTDSHHPCQALADLLTILEKKDRLAGINLAYIGDGNNVCHSLMIAAAQVGVNMHIATPKGYEPDPAVVEQALVVKRGMNKLVISDDPRKAATGADVLYTDVWASMGQEEEEEQRLRDFKGFCVDEKLLALADGRAIVMHCLPAHRGQEISAGAIDGPQSVVYDQAENRLHSQKALLATLLDNG